MRLAPRSRVLEGRPFSPFMEDDVTLAWRAAQGLAPSRLGGVRMPDWWYAGTDHTHDPDAPLQILAGPEGVAIATGPPDWPEPTAPSITVEEARRHEAAAAGERVADQPMGAFVTTARHEQVLVRRMRLQPGPVRTWTTVAPGAAPSEFVRLQEALGAYHVVMVDTVGVWNGTHAPTTGTGASPVLLRLTRQEGTWRYGIGYEPPAPGTPTL